MFQISFLTTEKDFELDVPPNHCKRCGSRPKDHRVINYDEIWRDGDIYCMKCGHYIRQYNGG